MSNRLKNYGLWVALAAFIALLLGVFGVKFDLGQYGQVVNGFLGLLVLMGIISNPTTVNKGFADDKPPELPIVNNIPLNVSENKPILPANTGQPVNPNAPPQ